MVRNNRLAIVPAVALLVGMAIGSGGCAGISVNAIHDPEFRFSGDTYGWGEQEIPQSSDLPYDLIDRLVKRAIDDQLSSQGFAEATPANPPDYVLLYYVGQEQITRVNTTSYPGYYGGYRGGRGRRGWGRAGWGGYGGATTTVSQYDEGSLTLDVLDGGSGELVWRGTAKSAVHPDDTAEQRQKKVNEVAAKLLGGFPPAGQ